MIVISDLFLKKYRPYRDWYQENGAYTVYIEGCLTDNPHERAPSSRDRFGRVHGIIPTGAPFASTALYLVKSCVIAATMATVRGWKRLGKAILKHNVPAVCQCGYKTHLDSLLRCAGLLGCDAEQTHAAQTQEQIPTQVAHHEVDEGLGFNLDTDLDGLYSLGYVPTQSMPPAYMAGFVQPHPFPPFPGTSTQPTQYPPCPDFASTSTQYPPISMDDPIMRCAYGFPPVDPAQTVAFGPAVQQSTETGEAHVEDAEAAESDDSLNHTPLALQIRGVRVRRQRQFSPSDY